MPLESRKLIVYSLPKENKKQFGLKVDLYYFYFIYT